MTGFAREVIRRFDPAFSYSDATREQINEISRNVEKHVRENPAFEKCSLRNLERTALQNFLVDEIAYLRSRLSRGDYEAYTTKSFRRRGRPHKLEERAKRVCLDAATFWDQQLAKLHVLDPEGIVQTAFHLVVNCSAANVNWRWRAVMVDEVQDLSQLAVSLLGRLLAPDGQEISSIPDGLFLVGDGAQSIYKKGFSLGSIGISVHNRSFVFKKNYRNSREILTAAFGLIKDFEFADVDEDSVRRPLEPDFATRHGERPFIVKCQNAQQESRFVAHRIKEILEEGDLLPAQICVIGTNVASRDSVGHALDQMKIPRTELREDAGCDGDRVKLSTIESAKGHEFVTVFIVGLTEGLLPSRNTSEDELPREAARLYVAMTRARDTLYLSYISSPRERPSQFLASIQQDCSDLQFTNDELLPID